MKGPKKPKPTEVEKWQAQISAEALQYVEKNYDPITREFLTDFARNEKEQKQMAMAQANTGVQQAFAQQEPAVEQTMAQRGVDPSSGAGLSTIQKYKNDVEAARSKAAQQAEQGSRRQFLGNTQSLAAQGLGQEANAMQQTNQLAESMNRRAIEDARTSAAARAGLTGAIGTAAGYGLGSAIDYINPPPANPGLGQPTRQPDIYDTQAGYT